MHAPAFTRALFIAGLLTVFSIPALALEWQIKDLGNLGGDDQYAADIQDLALGINNQGQVVGWSITPTEIFREQPRNFLQAFVSAPNGGPLTNLHKVDVFVGNTPTGIKLESFSQATAINDAGVVVFNTDRFPPQRAALFSPPPYVNGYAVVGGNGELQARDINNQGQIVGTQLFSPAAFITDTNGNYREFRDEAGDPISDVATGINDSGQVSLNGFAGGQTKAMIWSENEGARFIATNPDLNAQTVGINNSGQVLGLNTQIRICQHSPA